MTGYQLREQDRWLPIANVARLMKNTLPATAKVSKDAKECMQECVSEFISFITSEASDKCLMEKRKTINGEDILYSMNILGFENYSEVLKIYLAKYRQQQALKQERGEPRKKKTKPRKAGESDTENESQSETNEPSSRSPQNGNKIGDKHGEEVDGLGDNAGADFLQYTGDDKSDDQQEDQELQLGQQAGEQQQQKQQEKQSRQKQQTEHLVLQHQNSQQNQILSLEQQDSGATSHSHDNNQANEVPVTNDAGLATGYVDQLYEQSYGDGGYSHNPNYHNSSYGGGVDLTRVSLDPSGNKTNDVPGDHSSTAMSPSGSSGVANGADVPSQADPSDYSSAGHDGPGGDLGNIKQSLIAAPKMKTTTTATSNDAELSLNLNDNVATAVSETEELAGLTNGHHGENVLYRYQADF
ncbi:DEKNAAC102375 [Brettanomyces naardenensis]|uniref:DEKNAAC102375 n=1 Tax=Brettanomyces naardenensis TaxID=13370 RepID=A0A448YKB9_BRENA|nr:DEKNAAC102375 [Brettanomyces naardenensis]